MEMEKEIQKIRTRHKELAALVGSAEVISRPQELKKLSREYKELEEILALAENLEKNEKAVKETEQTLQEAAQEQELTALAEEELTRLKNEHAKINAALQEALRPKDPLDKKNIIVEIRAGAGGEEAALFAAELFRMYGRYAERKGWKTALISSNRTDIGGFKEAIFTVDGAGAYGALKYESGVHRIQRIPETEKTGRIHTSTATVAVLPAVEEVDIKIDPKDLKIETSTSRGHGGQSVNTTYSAIRLTHIPTGIMVSCQDERSQQQNRERAMQILRARLFAAKKEKAEGERREERRAQIGGGERAEKIRTYNFPQDRVTDHRLKENWHNIHDVMDGNLEKIIKAITAKK